ncbi:hypothetical protein BDZ89DRAFT_691393 [Hymenopellis radicata]|nr:hypothetical protein BDZ89DRAFT_691393 [Hymenopellis radicata]
MHLKHYSLRLLLDVLAHALWKTDFAVLKEHRRDVLSLLVQLLGTLNAKDIRIFMPLAACFLMFSENSLDVKKSVLINRMNIRAQNVYKSDSNPDYEQLMKAVEHTFKLYQKSNELNSDNWHLVWSFFNFAHSTNRTDLLVEDFLVKLPDVYMHRLLTTVLEDSSSYQNFPWLIQFILVSYPRPAVMLSLRTRILNFLEQCSA